MKFRKLFLETKGMKIKNFVEVVKACLSFKNRENHTDMFQIKKRVNHVYIIKVLVKVLKNAQTCFIHCLFTKV